MANDQPALRALFACESGLTEPEIGLHHALSATNGKIRTVSVCKNNCKLRYTRKNAQVVTNLQQICSNAVPTTCQQDVFALLVPSLLTSCARLVDNLLQGC
jgi:hypothetical protein